jgi:hypothetical protein
MGSCIPDGHPHRVANTRCRTDTVISADDGHIVSRNMQRIEINIQEKLCTKLVLFTRLYKDARSTKHKNTVPVEKKSMSLHLSLSTDQKLSGVQFKTNPNQIHAKF